MDIRKEHWVVWYIAKRWYEHRQEDLTVDRLREILRHVNERFYERFRQPLVELDDV